MTGLILWLVTGIIAGWLAGQVVQGGGFGFVWDLVLGLLGGVVGGFLMSLVGLSANGWIAEIVVAAIGAVVLVWISRFIRREAHVI